MTRTCRALLLVLCAAAAGCDNPAGGADGFRCALLLAGPENDAGWNQSAYEGLQRIRDELPADIRKVTARSPVEIRQALQRAAGAGFDLVIGHGFEFNAPAAQIAATAPAVAFVTTGGTRTAPNLASIVLRVEEVSYQLGVLAGLVSRSGVASAISGERFEPVRRVVEGFRLGFLSERPDGRVIEEYLGSWEDTALAKEKALAHARAGADVFFQNADAAGAGIFEACRDQGTLAFGCNRDQAARAPDVILASAVADIEGTLLLLAREAAAGRFQGGLRSFGMAEGKVRLAWNEQLLGRVSPEARARVAEAGRRMLAGEVPLPLPPAEADRADSS